MSVRDCLISVQTMSETEDQVKCLTLFLACVLLFPAIVLFCMQSATYRSTFEKLCLMFSCFPTLNKTVHFDETCCGHIVCFCTFSLFFWPTCFLLSLHTMLLFCLSLTCVSCPGLPPPPAIAKRGLKARGKMKHAPFIC